MRLGELCTKCRVHLQIVTCTHRLRLALDLDTAVHLQPGGPASVDATAACTCVLSQAC